ncbi:MAG TPA: hypothetical protein VMT55_04085, partial [Candidatus Sulfotelmatobacter sp.]|nr:hypothetical protein [Candidatus Sulfotelmatobacter sp.]
MSEIITSLSYDPQSSKVTGYYTEDLCVAVESENAQAAAKPDIAPAKPETGWLQALMTGKRINRPTGPGCATTPSESCQNKIPNSGAITRSTDYYDYNDPNRGPVTWKIANITNCDGLSDGNIKVTVVFGPNDKAAATMVRESDGSLSAVISRKLNPGDGGKYQVIITDKFGYSNDKANDLYLYPPNPAQAAGTNECTPKAGSLTIDQSGLNEKGQIVVGSKIKFILPSVSDCDGAPAQLKVVLKVPVSDPKAAESYVTEQEMTPEGDNYAAELDASFWGSPVTAVVTDLDPAHAGKNGKAPTFESSLWSLPPIVAPDLTACEINPKPTAFAPSNPDPAEDYDVTSNKPVTWTINGKNCDDSTTDLSAVCDFGPLGKVTGTSDDQGVITISTPLTQKIGGPIYCDVIGANKETLKNAVSIYPPYYQTPVSTTPVQTACEQNQDKPQAGALFIDPASLDKNGRQVFGTNLIFKLSGVATCDGKAGNFDVLLLAGANSVPMAEDNGVYAASVTTGFLGTPVRAQINDRDRGTTETRELWSLPPLVTPEPTACETNSKPSAGAQVGPTPGANYDVKSGQPVTWQVYLKNCDNSTDGLGLLCDFGPLGKIAGTVDDKGLATVQTPLTDKISGNFPCDVTGKNGGVLEKGLSFYPPYYAAPVTTKTLCEEAA